MKAKAATRRFDPVEIELDDRACKYLAAAMELYCRRLDGLKAGAETLARAADVKRYEDEAQALRDELVAPLMQREARILPHHLPILRKACALLAKNLTAARGTLTPLPETVAWIEELTARAAYVDGDLGPRFDLQRGLELDIRPTASDAGEGLAKLAAAEAED